MNTNSLVARCGERLENNLDFVSLDVPRLLTRLLLFDTYVMECSLRLRDVIALVRAIGIENTSLLLEAGGLRLSVETTTITFPTRTRDEILLDPPLTFSFGNVHVADQQEHIKTSLREIERISGCKHRKLSKLVQRAHDAIINPASGEDFGNDALETFRQELERNDSLLREAVHREAARRLGGNVPSDFQFAVQSLQDGSFSVDTDLATGLRLSPEETRDIVGRGLLGMAGLDLRLEQMRAFNSIAAFNDQDYEMMDRKLRQVIEAGDEGPRKDQLLRVVQLAHLPSLQDVDLAAIDFQKFIELRDSPQMKAFREWLLSAAAASDTEIVERIKDIRARVASVAEGKAGKTVRFAVATGAGVLPHGIGLVAGPTVGAIDTFVVDKVLGQPGPVVFFVKGYKSIFDG